MKYVLVIGDGMADYPIPELGNLTPLQAAYKPNMDAVAAKGRSGLLRTIPDGLNPGSDTAILSVLGYSPQQFCPARGALEAAARGIQLNKNDVAFRCNLITEKDGLLADYAAGHITSSEASQLIDALKAAFKKHAELEFFAGLDYRHFLVLRNFPYSHLIECTPPHDAVGAEVAAILPRAKSQEAVEAANLLRETIQHSKSILEAHPVNIARKKAGKKPGNMIWLWGGGTKPALPSFKEKYGLTAAVISAVDLVKGIGTYVGMRVISVEGATGLADTNYEGKADAVLKALEDHDFVFVHVEAPDEAGHVRDYKLKVKTIEDLDKRLVGRILDGLDEPFAIAILPDHPTPIQIGTHTRDPVPFVIQSPVLEADGVQKFDEVSASKGAFGMVENESLLSLLLSSASRSR
ncbi:MAG: cofactor-independent phosphoglycerate mutase [Candidatus Bathyarchaeota archaeon]|nr:cofactor-independent phosphoglycerate mutase [Candidatus Bathyarchaeota archaeon]